MLKVPRIVSICPVSSFSTSSPRVDRSQAKVFPLQHLSDHEKSVVDTARNFARRSVKPLVKQMDRDAKLDKKLVEEAFDRKLMGLAVSEKFGGSGGSFFDVAVTVEELAKVDPSVSLMVHIQNALAAPLLQDHGSEEQKEKYLPRVCKDTIGAFALSETGSGSDAFAMKTTATSDGDDFVLNGSKWGISNAPIADFFLVFATTNPEHGYKGVTCFVLDRNLKGLVVGEQDDNLGMRAGATSQLHFQNVRVPKSAVVGEIGKGYKYAIDVLNASRVVIGAQMVGLAQGCFEQTIPHLQERKQFGSRLIDFQGLQHQIARVHVEIEAARLLVYNTARLKDLGMPFVKDASIVKFFAPEVACKTAKQCVEWLGGIGFTKNCWAEKYYRDAIVGNIYEGTSNIQLNTIAKILDNEYKKK